ncbi:MAG: cyclic nucleotide-binding domain-containing protein [Gammaproteobacteria bacterium]|nr:cyclic nucleotide-binding domain-containing protein [Gammaproteobacteria bacterium]MCW5583716.1 cyclic nucleotide-binding domain-containing protein [Gammaproteobacteria bacterium]
MNQIRRLLINLINDLYLFTFNLKETIYHHVTSYEVQLIKETEIFNSFEKNKFDEMIASISLVKFKKGHLFKEGEEENAFYIVKEGSVQVFNVLCGKKIILANLNTGNYFGDVAFLGQARISRHENIEVLKDSTILIKIDKKFLIHILDMDKELKKRLINKGCKQALHALSKSRNLYNDIISFILEIENPIFLEKNKNDEIFHYGDEPDNVYIVIHGEVELRIPDINFKIERTIILHKGQLFGELGVIRNKPRSATAIAYTYVRLLIIEVEYFKKKLIEFSHIQKMLYRLQQLYRFPLRGTVDQYIESVAGKGILIRSVYKIDTNRIIVSNKFLEQDKFIMKEINESYKKYYYYQSDLLQIKLGTFSNKILYIELSGIWNDMQYACKALLDNEKIDDEVFLGFEKNGIFKLKIEDINEDEIICLCMSVTKNQLQSLIDNGINDIESLSKETGACTMCMGCQPRILELLGVDSWFSANMKLLISHTEDIASYIITPIKSKFNLYTPGQHIILQAKIGGSWIERPFTITGKINDGVRITIKKYPQGLLSQWLVKKANAMLDIRVSQPIGSFILNDKSSSIALCFAGGIGITPFFAFAEYLSQIKTSKKLNIIYCASFNENFIFKDEFNEIIENNPNINIEYRESKTEGRLTKDVILKYVKKYIDSDIYICGSEGFVEFVRDVLISNNCNKTKIFFEKFLYKMSH